MSQTNIYGIEDKLVFDQHVHDDTAGLRSHFPQSIRGLLQEMGRSSIQEYKTRMNGVAN